MSTGPCAGGVGEDFPDEEPNDGIEWIQNLGTPDGGICITGTIACGNDGQSFSNDLDLFAFQVDAAATGDFLLAWGDAAGDMDFTLSDANDTVIHEFEEGGSPETMNGVELDPANQYFLRIGCWMGNDTEYQMNVTWGTAD